MLSDRLVIIAILLIGAMLRIHALAQEVRFHPDEALFATFARNAAVQGDWMLSGALDKPPLSLYAAAISMQFTGVYVNLKGVLDLDLRQGEFSARLPSVFAGIVLIALVYALAHRVFDAPAAQFAALLAALSPQLVGFSATAFTDLLMLMLMLAALLAAVRGHLLWSGAWLALAVCTKQQGVFYLPLIVMWVILVQKRYPLTTYAVDQKDKRFRPIVNTHSVGQLMRFFFAFACGIVLLILWDTARYPSTSVFALAAVNNNPERFFIRLDELLPRLSIWLEYSSTFFGAWWLTFPLVVSGVWAMLQSGGRLIGLYIAAYFVLHWLIAFNTYDRYLLPIIPLLAIMIGRGLAQPRRFRRVLMVGLCVMMGLSPMRFSTDTRARDPEIIGLAHHVNAKPLGAIVYDHWLGWEMGYYLGAWSDKRRVYYPEPQILADDALLNPDPAPRYLIAPIEQDVSAWLEPLRENGFGVALDYRNGRYIVYRVTPAWCC